MEKWLGHCVEEEHGGMAYFLWDDDGVLQLLKEYEPAFLETFEELPANVERTDVFRILVSKYIGGIVSTYTLLPRLTSFLPFSVPLSQQNTYIPPVRRHRHRAPQSPREMGQSQRHNPLERPPHRHALRLLESHLPPPLHPRPRLHPPRHRSRLPPQGRHLLANGLLLPTTTNPMGARLGAEPPRSHALHALPDAASAADIRAPWREPEKGLQRAS
jgi:hypothetical protein